MKKGLLILLTLLCTWNIIYAVPAKRGFVKVEQSDGTTILVETIGDEHFHCFRTVDGLTVARATNGDLHYCTTAGLSDVIAHNPDERTTAELSFIEVNSNIMQPQAIRKARKQQRATALADHPQIPSLGSPRIPILIIDFQDIKMKHTMEDFKKQFHSGEKSILSYYIDQSNGEYTPQFDLYGIYRMPYDRVYYGYDTIMYDYRLPEMIVEAVEQSDSEVDWSQYDNDGDGEVDVCIVLFAGVSQAQASLTVPDAIWPCQSELDAYKPYGSGEGHVFHDGMKINRFAVFCELSGNSDEGTAMDGIGTFCHEYSHCLGLPDWYPTNGTDHFGMSYWSLMDQGCYNGTVIDGDTPIGYNAYEKNFLGWLDFIIPEENTRYNLPVFNQGNDQAIKIVSPLNENEFFILENRAQQGWDIHIPDEGVLVTHFTYIPERWEDNTPNNEEIQLGTIVPADGAASDYNLKTDLYGESNHELTDTSLPAARLNMHADGTLADKAGGAGLLGKPITKIYLNDDKSATLWYMRDDVPQVATPTLNEATDITDNSFTASWSHESDIPVTYTLQVNRIKKAVYSELMSELFTHLNGSESNIASKLDDYTSNKGWSGSNLFEGSGYLLMSAKNFPGKLTTPPLDLSAGEGKVSLIIKAASHGEGTSHKLTIKSSSETEEIILTDTPQSYCVVLECEADAEQEITLSSERNKRVELYEVTIFSGDASAEMEKTPARATATDEKMVITEITTKHYTLDNLIAGDTYIFKVQAIPVNIATADESEWSNECSVVLTDNSAVIDITTQQATDATIVGYYDLTGRQLSAPVKGINIVRYSDGTSRKVIIE